MNLIFIALNSNIFTANSSLLYSRLNSSTNVKSSQSAVSLATSTATAAGDVSRRIIRCLSKPKIAPLSKYTRPKTKCSEEVEREWLLLGEPQSPRNTVILDDEHDTMSLSLGNTSSSNQTKDVESALTSNVKENASCSDTDSSTDIDAIVDEYRQTVKVTTAATLERIKKVPSTDSWKLSIVCVTITCFGIALCMIGIHTEIYFIFCIGLMGKKIIKMH